MPQQDRFTLENRTAVVTGASSGIGAAIAVAMADAGARVVIVGRDAQRLAVTRERIVAAGGQAHAVIAELTAPDAPAAVVDGAVAAFGSLDVLVHAAGVFHPRAFEQTPLDSFDTQMAVNVRAPFAITQRAIPHLRGGGVVIFLSSISGHVGFPNAAAYCATKGAIELLTKALTMEFAREGIRFNAIAPGNVHTPMNAHLYASKEYEAAMLARTPSGRTGLVDDIADVAVFLASNASRYVHGASLLVDGGWTAQ